MSKSLKADLWLILVTLFWGAGFPLTKFALQTISPMYHIGLRFLIAGVLLGLIFCKKLKHLNRETIKASFVLSIFLFGCYALQTIGLQYTTASKSGFFSGLSVLVVPFISIFYLKAKLKPNAILGIIAATAGLYFLTSSGGHFTFNIGDFLTVLGVLCYGWQLLFTGTYVQKYDPTLLSIVQMFFVSIFGFIGAFSFEKMPTSITELTLYSLLFSAVLCTAFAFWMQTVMQRFTPASHIALIWTMEPVFGALTSYLILGELLGTKGIIGGVLVVCAMIVTEVRLPRRKAAEVKELDG